MFEPEPFGRYLLMERIAVGGMAEIFRAKSRSLAGFEKVLAIKRLHPRYGEDVDFIKMLIEEARISVGLAHVNIAQIFDLDKIEDHYFIAMELVEGRDLYRVLRRMSEREEQLPVEYYRLKCLEVPRKSLHFPGWPPSPPHSWMRRDRRPEQRWMLRCRKL